MFYFRGIKQPDLQLELQPDLQPDLQSELHLQLQDVQVKTLQEGVPHHP